MENKQYAYNRVNCLLSSIIIFAMISSFGLFLTYILLLTTNSQFIAFNEFAGTGKCPAVYYFIAIILALVYLGTFIVSCISLWSTADILNKWNQQTKSIFISFKSAFAIAGFLQLAAGIATVIYMRALPWPLREYMADNLRSNYTGGFGMGYLDRQYDRYVDWVQINYQCCGVVSYEDYRNGFYYNTFNKYTIVNIVPASCCMYRESLVAPQVVSAPVNGPSLMSGGGASVNLAPSQPSLMSNLAGASAVASGGSQTEYQATSRCQMKSINIYRKGCYDILMWWMESFGTLIAALSIGFGVLYLFGALVSLNIYRNIKHLKWMVGEKEDNARIKAKMGRMMTSLSDHLPTNKHFNNYHRNFNHQQDPSGCGSGSGAMDSTMNETISYVESRT